MSPHQVSEPGPASVRSLATRTRRENREEELRKLNPQLRAVDLSALDDSQVNGLISAAIRGRDRSIPRRIKRRR